MLDLDKFGELEEVQKASYDKLILPIYLSICIPEQPGEGQTTTKTTTISTQNCKKIFIQRDYSEGCNVKFMTKFPTELQVHHIDYSLC